MSHMIHIIDTEHPWDVYCISSGHTEVISCLEWDQSGEPALLQLSFVGVGVSVVHVDVPPSVCRIPAVVRRR